MAVEIPTARYWRISLCRPATGSGYHDAVMRLVTLRLADSSGTPIGHSAITHVGSLGLINGTVIANVGDANNATDAQWGSNSVYVWTYGNIHIRYDMGSPVAPAKLITRFNDTAINLGWVGGAYNMVGASVVYGFIEASTDDVNWSMVSRIASVAPGGFNVDNVIPIDSVPAFYYTNDIKKPISGDGGIYGIVAEDGIPVARQVLLYEREFFHPIRRTMSTVDGAYSFTNLNRDREYLVMAIDSTEEPGQPGMYKNALVRDRITPIPANGLPTDGLPWFFRVRRSMQTTPSCQWNYYGPGTNVTGAYGMGRGHAIRYSTFIDTGAGGGYDLRGLPMPVPTGLRVAYPKSLNPTQWINGEIVNPAEFSVELIAEVPSGSDQTATFVFGGVGDYSGYPWTYALGNSFGMAIEITTAGVVNIRFASSLSSSLAIVRATGNATPGTLAHIVVSYLENQNLCLYINGALVQNASMAGVGQIKTCGINSSGSYASGLRGAGYYSGVTNGPMQNLCYMWHFGGLPMDAFSNPALSRLDSGVVWGAAYARALHTDPDAGGVPISVRDLYESWANNAVWTGGSRPNGWPTVPQFSGYGIEVAADAPAVWFRLQEIDNLSYVQALGSAFSGGYYTGTGITYQQPGMTAGLNSIGFAQHGALRIAGNVDTDTGAAQYTKGSHYTVSETGAVEFWMRPSAFTNAQASIFNTYSLEDNTLNLWVYTNTSGNVVVRFRDASGAYFTYTFGKVFLTATAYHVAVVWDGVQTNKIALYVDGVKHSEQGFFFTPYSGYGTFHMNIGNALDDAATLPYNGTVTGATNNFNGDLQDVAVYSYPLSAARIAAHYAARNN